MEDQPRPKLDWDWGTAYDLFASLNVLHEPNKFGLRGSWAAGVRSRLPNAEREILEDAQTLFHIPAQWVYGLPSPKDSASALRRLEHLAPERRLPALAINSETPPQVAEALMDVMERGAWDERDQDVLRDGFNEKGLRGKILATILDWWARGAEFGERYLAALQSYQQVFFAEEEARIRPALQDSLEHAKALSKELTVPELVEDLSQGLRFESLMALSELILAPSYWTTPLVVFSNLGDERMLLLYGARPVDASLVPGEVIPDALLLALKALADPTRLRILRYLAVKPLTPAQLSRRLRLRAPTVIHHLNTLRLAGLVYLTLESGGERRYAMRTETVESTFRNLGGFLEADTRR
ncbi:MAG TPA: transcriptional regulator [Anaerolineales bacterium]|nr:transcriptional regulator [Anaerolineales bacterium]